MKKVLFSILIFVLLAAVGCRGQTISTPSPIVTPTPTQTPVPLSQESWTTYSNADFVFSIAFEGDDLWLSTQGGVLLVDPADQTCLKYTSSNSGLVSSFVRAVAIDSSGNKWFGT